MWHARMLSKDTRGADPNQKKVSGPDTVEETFSLEMRTPSAQAVHAMVLAHERS